MNRRLRLALFLAALAATGPMPSARVVDAARAEISIAWFRGDGAVIFAANAPARHSEAGVARSDSRRIATLFSRILFFPIRSSSVRPRLELTSPTSSVF